MTLTFQNILKLIKIRFRTQSDYKKEFIVSMITAQKSKVFVNNQTYTVNIPPEFNFQAEEVYVNKIGDVLMMTPVSRLAETLEQGAAILASYSQDFLKDGQPEEILF